jgi:hypothetical protein
MNFNWNVYKLFKNGKRAKAPLHTFYYEGKKEEANTHFVTTELPLLNQNKKNLTDLKYEIINSEDNQERTEENESEKKFTKEKNRVLANILRSKNIKSKRGCVGGLILCKESNWMWQWAALEGGTNLYVSGLSQEFKSYDRAIQWMKEQISAVA